MPTASEERARVGAGAFTPVSDRSPSTLDEAVELGMVVSTLITGESSGEWIASTPTHAHVDDDGSEDEGGEQIVLLE